MSLLQWLSQKNEGTNPTKTVKIETDLVVTFYLKNNIRLTNRTRCEPETVENFVKKMKHLFISEENKWFDLTEDSKSLKVTVIRISDIAAIEFRTEQLTFSPP